MNFGPGYRVYLHRRGDVVVILLCGGDKNSQIADISHAKALVALDVQEQAALLREAFASGETNDITAALGAVARARGMTALAERTGLSRSSLYRALSDEGDPQLSTLLTVLAALGFGLELARVAVPGELAPSREAALIK